MSALRVGLPRSSRSTTRTSTARDHDQVVQTAALDRRGGNRLGRVHCNGPDGRHPALRRGHHGSDAPRVGRRRGHRRPDPVHAPWQMGHAGRLVMIEFSATDLGQNTRDVLEAAKQDLVSIRKHGRPQFVLMSQEAYDLLMIGGDPATLVVEAPATREDRQADLWGDMEGMVEDD
ncbi:MAG TPA: hypothetical protein DEO85_09095 [Maritimibacter sp.]|nr:hypothetical protein [Maritimibacter sp.]